jgi:hypothetical protein
MKHKATTHCENVPKALGRAEKIWGIMAKSPVEESGCNTDTSTLARQ